MACISPENPLQIFIPSYEIKGEAKVTKYVINVKVGEYNWNVLHRYSAFAELHESLVSNHGLAKDLLPPKRIIGNKNAEFIKKRQKSLEAYLQKVVSFLSVILPDEIAEFLKLKEYEANFLLQTMAKDFFQQEEKFILNNSSLKFSPLQLMAISVQLNCPNTLIRGLDNNFTNIVDACSSLWHLTIEGSSEKYKSSNIILNNLSYSLNVFKSLQTVTVLNACLTNIDKLGNLRKTVEKIKMRNCNVQHLKDLFLCDFIHKDVAPSDDCLWPSLLQLDLSSNHIESIHESICLAPNLQTLTLASNKITELGSHLIKLPQLISLNLCNNKINSLVSLNTKLGNIKILNLSQNYLKNLEGLSKLYSVVILNVSSNSLNSVSDVEFIRNLPCLEELILTGNPVSTIVDYRAKILELFDKKAWEICLDNEKSTQKELDKVAVLQALRTAREGRLPSFPLSPPMPTLTNLICERPDMGSIAKE